MQKKVVIVIEGGVVQSVYADHPHDYDVEIVDLDIQDNEERAAAEERLNTIQQYLPKIY